MRAEWFKQVEDGSLEQGDLLSGVAVYHTYLSSLEEGEMMIDSTPLEIIVLSQTCDIENRNLSKILVAKTEPLYAIEQIDSLVLRQLRQNTHPSMVLLPNSEERNIDWTVVRFHDIYTVDSEILRSQAVANPSHFRLLSPYRENFSQMIARHFMRVALTEELRELDIKAFMKEHKERFPPNSK